ncbi:hypothetical protein [Tenacibaculum jejuense]|uniref:Type II secretion system protein GspG C-terminal domain-containing protein n=1 Tax=Tenacibaculum jejuense TaxID=584609 RepID=A0A238UEW8_9FLAO|nr:hypothetical protein [Tenacibaculum jejuense]SNR17753.1 conserved protein of unknown function [Tenacibaculum jejuense]
MRSPYERVGILLGVLMGVIIVLKIIFFFSGNSLNESVTKNKVVEIKALLEKEKEVFGKYPDELNIIKRNNPLRNYLLADGWGTTFSYKVIEDTYFLSSAGSDKEINTKDDLNFN